MLMLSKSQTLERFKLWLLLVLPSYIVIHLTQILNMNLMISCDSLDAGRVARSFQLIPTVIYIVYVTI